LDDNERYDKDDDDWEYAPVEKLTSARVRPTCRHAHAWMLPLIQRTQTNTITHQLFKFAKMHTHTH